MKKILVLGGTMFVGRAVVDRLKNMPGYDVTLFNRGKSNTELFADMKQIHGDRETDGYLKICEQHWDCIIDFSGYYPVTFEKLLAALKGNVDRYVFISTISVFDLTKAGGKLITETTETLACTEEQATSKLPAAYGEKKAEMERILLKQDWLDKIIFRPSFIYGKFDWTERFYYWLYRAKFADKILMPGNGTNYQMSLTNADDLTEALLLAIEIGKHDTIYNTISQRVSSLRDIVATTAKALGREPKIIDADKALQEQHNIKQGDFPLYVPLNFEIDDTLWLRDFPFERKDMVRSLLETLDHKEAAGFPKPPAGLAFDREQEVINA